MSDKLHAMLLSACGNVNRIISELRSNGASLPKAIDSWSCDQKIAFVAALGPFGFAALAAGALVEGLAVNTAAEVAKYSTQALSAVTNISKQLGLNPPDISLPSVIGDTLSTAANDVKNFASKPFGGMGGFSADFRSANHWTRRGR